MANTTSKPSLVFFGTGPVSLATLEALLRDFQLEAVITKPTAGHHQALVKDWAVLNKITVFEPADKEQLISLFAKAKFKSQVGLVVDYGLILPKEVLSYFPLGIINSHFSLLPQWRGADPITFAILSGQSKTGVSLMIIEEELDTGKLLTYKSLAIPADATTPSLTKSLVVLSNQLLADYLPRYIKRELKAKAQPHPGRATYSKKISKPDGLLNWVKTADILEREVRAYIGWPGSYTKLAGRDVTITKARIGTPESEPKNKPGEIVKDKDELIVQTGYGLLVIEQVKPAGKNEMSGADFIRGYLSRNK